MTDDYPTAKDLKDGLRRVFGVDSDLWQYFDSIEEKSRGVIPAEAPLKKLKVGPYKKWCEEHKQAPPCTVCDYE